MGTVVARHPRISVLSNITVMTGYSISVLSGMAAINYQLHVAINHCMTRDIIYKFYLILVNLNVNSHM